MIRFTLKVPIYGSLVYIYIVDDIKAHYTQSKSFRKRSGFKTPEDADAEAVCITDTVLGVYFNKPNLNDDTISHELFHITRAILNQAGIGLTETTEESWAYLNGWLNGEIRKKLKKKGVTY